MNKKKWLTLSLVGTALLLIPRRSSRQTSPDTGIATTDIATTDLTTNDKISASDKELKPEPKN